MLLRAYTGVVAWWNVSMANVREDRGATAVEYALMLALIAIVIVAAVAFLGHAVSNRFSTMGSGVNNA